MTQRKSIFILTSLALGAAVIPTAKAMAADIAGIPVRGFWDTSYLYNDAEKSNTFRLNALDIFLSKQVDKRVSFLTEMAFEPDEDNNIGLDLERIYVQYEVDPWFKVSAGRYHTAFGYWNETFHHGRYLYSTVDRPTWYRFEDQGGLLPVHSVGLEFRGNGQVGGGNLGYMVNLSNGRGTKADPPQLFQDVDKFKAIGGVVFYEMDNGLRFGVNVYRDTLPGPHTDSTGTLHVGPMGNELIYGAHITYNSPSIEFLTEGFREVHNFTSGEDPNTISMFYAQLGYHWDLFTPYFRFEYTHSEAPDPYFAAGVADGGNPLGLLLATGSNNIYVGGVRYELSAASALKLEYDLLKPSGQDGLATVTLNWSVAF